MGTAKLETLLDAVQRDPQATAIICAGEGPLWPCMQVHPTFRAMGSSLPHAKPRNAHARSHKQHRNHRGPAASVC